MLDRQKGDCVFECDGCTETLETHTGDFIAALNMAKREGWRTVKAGDDWNHFCPRCQVPRGR